MTDLFWEPLLASARPGPGFVLLARQILFGTRLIVGGASVRPVEIEMYFHTTRHPDPFSHRQPIQRTQGRWYLHRMGTGLRSGSFKGVDLTFGYGDAHGGMLLRTVETSEGRLVEGPSLVVDHFLSLLQMPDIRVLDVALGERLAWDADAPIRMEKAPFLQGEEPLACARVGLSLRRFRWEGPAARFLILPYRFLREPARLRKGKVQMNLALHIQGVDPASIRATTGCTAAALARQIEAFELGWREGSFEPYWGRALDSLALAHLHGVWQRTWGAPTDSSKEAGNGAPGEPAR
ncbi:MAG: hypothetical protein U0840_21415 [Gemmataceae bacterium]